MVISLLISSQANNDGGFILDGTGFPTASLRGMQFDDYSSLRVTQLGTMQRGRRIYQLVVLVTSSLCAYRAGRAHRQSNMACMRENPRKHDVFTSRSLVKSSEPTPATSRCSTDFVRYEPSNLEKIWHSKIQYIQSDEHSWSRGCELLQEDLDQIVHLLNEINKHNTDRSSASLSNTSLSAFHYRDSCTGDSSVVYIEPLISFLRHPLSLCTYPNTASADILDKSYLLVPYREEVMTSNTRKFLFDAGASTYDTGAGGASQSWFVNKYRSRGIEFDRIIGWEAAPTDSSEQWGSVPADVKRITSWFNIPVKTEIDSADNPFTFIKHLTEPEDFVVFKLDIDTPVVEMELVKQFMEDSTLITLIDEFYFEHHVSGSPMQWHGWGDLQGLKTPMRQLADSYELFASLRHRGVRAHSWV